MRAVPQAATDFVVEHEGLCLESYSDPGGAWTIGYGHTGPEVHGGLRITLTKARSYLADDLQTTAARLQAVVKREVIEALTEHQYAALLSFVFNLGADPKWTIWKRLNAGQYDQVPAEMTRFVYVGKTKIQGLVNRRAAEVALWSTGEPGSVPDTPPSSFTRAEVTPPAVTEPTPIHRQGAFIAICCTILLGAPEAIGQMSAAVTPYAAQSRIAARLLDLLANASPIAAAVGALTLWLKSRQAKL